MEVPRPPVYYSPKHSVVSCCEGRGLLGDVVLSRRSQPLGFTQAALTPQRDPRRGESKGKPAANSKSDGIPGERSSKVLHKRLSRRSGTREVEENPKANQQT
ncbi:hypothetical protein NDU88_009861 [Pleurodeles waltl]|uniref:Uncharacterized protein n=1 Tax=Pleurodeles waltl TaxID=8319 RepID=A0AAV7QYK0_PLEWA|nr:hypothetical protein NDU88_009861 [Pleurodeles waltl]